MTEFDDFEDFTFVADEEQLADDERVSRMREMQAAYEGFFPDIFQLTKYFRNATIPQDDGSWKFFRLVGEEKNVLTAAVTFLLAKQPLVIRSFAGTGKTVITDMVMSVCPEEYRYVLDMSSGLGIWAEADAINAASYLFFPELQNAGNNEDVVKVWKKWGEGRNARRSRTDITTRAADGENYGSVRNELEWKPFVSTFALENDGAKTIYNDEMRRRVLELCTDITEKQTKNIVDSFLTYIEVGEQGMDELGDEAREMMRLHFGGCIDIANGLNGVRFPGARAMLQGLPTTFVETRSAVKILMKVIEGYAIYHYKNRIITDDGYLLASPEDLYLAWLTYGELFVQKALKVDSVAQPLLDEFPNPTYAGAMLDENCKRSVTQIQKQMKERGVGLSKTKVEQLILQLEDHGLLEKDSSGVEGKQAEPKYFKTGMATFENVFSYEEIIRRCHEIVSQYYPSIAEQYIQRHNSDSKLIHPITGEEVSVVKKNPVIRWS